MARVLSPPPFSLFLSLSLSPPFKVFVSCIRDRLPNRHSFLNLYSLVIKFSLSLSLFCVFVCVFFLVCVCVFVFPF